MPPTVEVTSAACGTAAEQAHATPRMTTAYSGKKPSVDWVCSGVVG
jgi:hypothetical protein